MIHEQTRTRTAEYQQTIDRLREEANDARESLENCITAARAIDPNCEERTGDAMLAWANVSAAKATHHAAFAAFVSAVEAEK